jgi:hypothetical protein
MCGQILGRGPRNFHISFAPFYFAFSFPTLRIRLPLTTVPSLVKIDLQFGLTLFANYMQAWLWICNPSDVPLQTVQWALGWRWLHFVLGFRNSFSISGRFKFSSSLSVISCRQFMRHAYAEDIMTEFWVWRVELQSLDLLKNEFEGVRERASPCQKVPGFAHWSFS